MESTAPSEPSHDTIPSPPPEEPIDDLHMPTSWVLKQREKDDGTD